MRVYEQVLGRTGHPNLIDTYANLGSLLTKVGDLPGAKDHLCKALGLNTQLRGAGHTLVGNDHANLGRYYFASGDKPAAAEQFRKALDIYKENVKPQAPAEKASLHRGSADLAEAQPAADREGKKRRRRSSGRPA